MNLHETLEEKAEERRWVKMVNGIEIPMTEEEISQRLAEEEQWEREKDNHKIILLTPPEGYELRLVAFIDILGWKNLIKKSQTDVDVFKRLWKALKRIQTISQANYAFSDNPLILPPFYDIAEVSDSIAISVKIQSQLTEAIHAIQAIKTLQKNLLLCELICRGGAVLGPVIHERSMIFGPALLQAIEIEKKVNEPRIIIASPTADIFNTLYCNLDGSIIGESKDVRQDPKDGCWFVDYLSPSLRMMERQHPELQNYRRIIDKLINDPDNQEERFRLKYQWLVDYFNSVLKEYPETNLEPLILP